AALLPSYLRRKRVLLLCDDLDEASDDEFGRVLGHLARMGVSSYRRVRVLATANSAAREVIVRQIGDNKTWRICDIAALELEDLGGAPSITPRLRGKGAADFMASLHTHLLDEPHLLAVALTALKQSQDGAANPYGIAQLLATDCVRRCESVASEDIPA